MTEPSRHKNLVSLQQSNAKLLQQLIACLTPCPDEQYTAAPSFAKGSIGAHTRHILDYYLAFYGGLEQGQIDYCQRQRDPLIETRTTQAIELALTLIDQLANVASTYGNKNLRMTDGDFGVQFDSNIERELSFLANHALHHFASIAYFASDLGVATPEGFGLAPSTIQHIKKATRVHT